MRQNGISVVRARKHKVTTDSDNKFNIAPNLLDRNFTADEPNQKWAGDISWTPALTLNWRNRPCRKPLILSVRVCEPIPEKRVNTGPQLCLDARGLVVSCCDLSPVFSLRHWLGSE